MKKVVPRVNTGILCVTRLSQVLDNGKELIPKWTDEVLLKHSFSRVRV